MSSIEKFAAGSLADCFALLDDNESSDADLRSRLYTDLCEVLVCRQAADLPDLLNHMQQALNSGRHAVGLFTYELGIDLLRVAPIRPDKPLAQILIFNRCEKLSSDAVDLWLRKRIENENADAERPAGIANLHANITQAEFVQSVARIHEYIKSGDTYQVNYTYRLRFDSYGALAALYLKLRIRQPVPYGALIMLPNGEAVLSLSPELFARHRQGQLTARPMKGTAPATGDPLKDEARSLALAADSKNRAENLMIVDLLRNDLGRIAAIGSVRVPALFDVNRYGSVLQMTSTVQAQLKDEVTLPDIFRGIYPCGSITGAPKLRTMEIIHELEPEQRGYYTGSIGWFEPASGGRRVGDFCLSVPIRTLTLSAPGEDGVRKGEMGVGAGIVYDSNPEHEYTECLLKAAFMSDMPADFDLFETMFATRAEGCRHLDRHIQRLRTSAAFFRFPFDESELRKRISAVCSELQPDIPHRIRVSIGKNGLDVQKAPLTPLDSPVRLLLAKQQTSADDLFLKHKTTVRKQYDTAFREAEKRGAFDMLFFNSRGELTEGGRSNVFIRQGGRWFTPPLESGVLPGVMRSVLLADPAWNAEERRLTLADLKSAEQVVVTNALRGIISATVIWEDDTIIDLA